MPAPIASYPPRRSAQIQQGTPPQSDRRGVRTGREGPSHFAWLLCVACCWGISLSAAGQDYADRAKGKPKAVPLQPCVFDTPAAVPFALRRTIEEPELEFGPGVAVEVEDAVEVLKLDLNGDGELETTVPGDVPQVLRLRTPTGDQPVLVAKTADRWWFSPAGTLVGQFKKRDIVLLDGDGDGLFDGPKDWLRFGDGSLYPVQPNLRVLGDGSYLATWELEPTAEGTSIKLQALGPCNEITKIQWRALLAANAFRNAAGLHPVRLNRERCVGCQKHARYLHLNNYDFEHPKAGIAPDDESPGKPGYSQEGRVAAAAHTIWKGGDAAGAIQAQTATMLHRPIFLGVARFGLGAGAAWGEGRTYAAGYSVAGIGFPEVTNLDEIVLVPAPGQRAAPRGIQPERPLVDGEPTFYERKRGYPISATWGGLPVLETQMRLLDAKGKVVPGRCFTPEQPVHPELPLNGNSSFFVADAPLRTRVTYTVELRGEFRGDEFFRTWQFTAK